MSLCPHMSDDFCHTTLQVLEFLHVKPGKGSAFVRTKVP